MDNLTENEQKRLVLLTNIKKMLDADYHYKDIAATLGISMRTVIRYKDCNPLEQCHLKRPSRKKELYKYKDEIIRLLNEGYHAAGIAREMKEKGCPLGNSTIRKYAKELAHERGDDISRYRKDPKAGDKETLKTLTAKTVVIKKQDIIKLLWMNKSIESINRDSLYRQYPIIQKLQICINEFRHIFIYKSIPRLYLFIERYKKSEFVSIASFAKGLERDIDAVENAVVSPLSNGFVEGINNRTKMIKRIMYGRCGLELLSAKIMLPYA